MWQDDNRNALQRHAQGSQGVTELTAALDEKTISQMRDFPVGKDTPDIDPLGMPSSLVKENPAERVAPAARGLAS
jgi:hypothetical protein